MSRDNWKKEFETLSKEMDKRQDFLDKLIARYPNYEDCPEQWQSSWKVFEKDKFRNWRHIPGVMRRLKSAAKKKCKFW